VDTIGSLPSIGKQLTKAFSPQTAQDYALYHQYRGSNPIYYSDVSGNTTTRATNDTPTKAGFVAGDEPVWGGYTSTVFVDPNTSKLVNDPTASGQSADVARYQSLAQAAAAVPAYQTNFSAANQYASLGDAARASQVDAMNLDAAVANGAPTQATQLSQQMLQQGAQAQRAGAMSMRGGSLAQAAAMRQQQGTQGSYMQTGNQQIAAQQAAEQAQARQQYMQDANNVRQGDYSSMNLTQQQTLSQQQNELQQRQINQQAQMGYEQLGYNVNDAAQQAALKNQQIEFGVYDVNQQANQQDLNRIQNLIGYGASMVGSGLGAGAAMGSDERMKFRVRRLSLAQAVGGS